MGAVPAVVDVFDGFGAAAIKDDAPGAVGFGAADIEGDAPGVVGCGGPAVEDGAPGADCFREGAVEAGGAGAVGFGGTGAVLDSAGAEACAVADRTNCGSTSFSWSPSSYEILYVYISPRSLREMILPLNHPADCPPREDAKNLASTR